MSLPNSVPNEVYEVCCPHHRGNVKASLALIRVQGLLAVPL